LHGRVLAAHAVQLSDADIALLAARGAAVAHCPGSNAKLAAGVARVTALRRAGIRVGLGTDGPASGDDLDLWAEARLAGLLARVTSGDAAALTASELLLMATRDGAAAIGRDDLGALEPGRWADLVHLDLDVPAFVAPDDDAQLMSNLVWAGGSRAVRDVWVAGEQVLADTEPTRVDRRATTAALRSLATHLRP
jgi:5-methylthioadenosine/S-adenosylhomocysteine deaminase